MNVFQRNKIKLIIKILYSIVSNPIFVGQDIHHYTSRCHYNQRIVCPCSRRSLQVSVSWLDQKAERDDDDDDTKTTKSKRLSLSLFPRRRKLAFLSAFMFCLSPPSMFMSSIFTESPFAALTFYGMLWFVSGYHLTASLIWGVASAVRSNAIVYAGFFIYNLLTGQTAASLTVRLCRYCHYAEKLTRMHCRIC